MRSLDAMSILKEAAITIVRGQFSEVLTMFLRKDLNSLLGDKSEISCQVCSYGGETLLIIEHALLILNRCLIQQIDAVITNTTQAQFLYSLFEDSEAEIEYGVSDVIQVCIWDEYKTVIEQTFNEKQKSSQIRFCTLSFLTQALVNIIVLSGDQDGFI